MSDNRCILFLSRGRGRGHAMPDSVIADAIHLLAPAVPIRFASYGSGADALRSRGCDPIDLDIDAETAIWEPLCRMLPHLSGRGGVFVAHEEPLCIPAAYALGWSTVFLTDWLLDEHTFYMQALKFVDELIMLDDPGHYTPPAFLQNRTLFTGPVLGSLPTADTTRHAARRAYDISQDTVVILVTTGAYAEAESAIVPIIPELLDSLANVHLLWVSELRDYDLVAHAFSRDPRITVLRPHDGFIGTIAAADVMITKGNRISVFEAAAMGVPSISITSGTNAVEDRRLGSMPTNIAFTRGQVSPAILRRAVAHALSLRAILRPVDIAVLRRPPLLAAQKILDRWAGTSVGPQKTHTPIARSM